MQKMKYLYVFIISILFLFPSLWLLLLAKRKSGQQQNKSLPPGQTGWFIIGESLDFLSDGRKGHPEKFLFDRTSKLSSDIFTSSLFGVKTIVFCGAANNKFLFQNENKLVQSWWPSSVNKLFPSSTESSSSEESLKMRKMLPNFFKPEALQRYVGIIDEMTEKHFNSYWDNKDKVIAALLTKTFTFSLACRLFLSLEDPEHVAQFSKRFNLLASGIFSIPINLPGTVFNRAIKASDYIKNTFLQGLIKKRKVDLENGTASPTQDILSHMLSTCDEEGKFMTEDNIADKILGLLVGGHDTASSTCAMIVMYLAELPHIYDGVYKEQMEIAKSKAPGELLNWDDVKKMKYSWNVACEVLRLAAPLQGTFREAISDFQYHGFSIPKGWKIYWSTNSTHRSAEYFPEPEKFDPSRFEGAGPAPYTYVPFGGGPRMCPGREYGRLEILVFMHHLVKRFRWEKVFPREKITFNPSPYPEKNLPIRLFPHKS